MDIKVDSVRGETTELLRLANKVHVMMTKYNFLLFCQLCVLASFLYQVMK